MQTISGLLSWEADASQKGLSSSLINELSEVYNHISEKKVKLE